MKTILIAIALFLTAPAAADAIVFEVAAGYTLQDSDLPDGASTRELTFHGQRLVEVSGAPGLVLLLYSNGTNEEILYGYITPPTSMGPVLGAIEDAKAEIVQSMPVSYDDKDLRDQLDDVETAVDEIPTDTARKEDVDLSLTVTSPRGPFFINVFGLMVLAGLVLFDVKVSKWPPRGQEPGRQTVSIREDPDEE